jgi:4-hydroxybenzoyl-CoA thioesterase
VSEAPQADGRVASRHPVRIAWGDCDEAGIVFYPNYFYWMDSAFQTVLRTHGLNQRLLRQRYGVVGTPIVDAGARFRAPASYEDLLSIEARIDHWGSKSFRVAYVGLRAEVVVFDGFEVRVWATAGANGGLKTAPIAPEFRTLLGGPAGTEASPG